MNAITQINRRQLLISAFVVGGGMAIGVRSATAAVNASTPGAAFEFSTWLSIAADDTIIVHTPTPETGNGAMTQCALSVAEELGCDWTKVRGDVAPAVRAWQEGQAAGLGRAADYFAGRSTADYKMKPLLQVGASARERLKAAAAQVWSVPVAEIAVKDSVLTHKPTGRTLRFGQVAERAATIKLEKEPAIKPQSQWTLLGKVTPGKLANVDVVQGKANYGIDVRLPNMLYAVIKQSPVQGGKLKSHDPSVIKGMKGVQGVVVIDPDAKRFQGATQAPPAPSRPQSAIAVVADHFWQAKMALDKLEPTLVWEDGAGAKWETTEQAHAATFKACETAGTMNKKNGDPTAKLAEEGGTRVEASYLTPFCDHAPIEPLNGTAMVTPDRVDMWLPSPGPMRALAIAVEQTGLKPDNIHINTTLIGGAFGRRNMGDDVGMVLAVAKAFPGRPVHTIWTREEMFRQGRYRPLQAARLTAKLGSDGMPTAVLARIAGVGASVDGVANSPYLLSGVPDFQVDQQRVPMHIMTSSYRGPGYNSNAFILETFIDECAVAAKMDPVEYRLKLLGGWADKGYAKCLETVRKESGWGAALPRGQGRGVAVSNWGGGGKPFVGTTAAAVAHVEVSQKGELKVHSLDVAFDCGTILNKNAALAQIESGVLFGLNMAMNEGLTIAKGRIVEGNFDEYPMVRMADVPKIRIHLGGLTGHERFGELGEPGVGPIGPAIANAVFVATGKRIRETPFRKQDLSWT